MKSVEWNTYRTRFLVQAKQLSSALTFVDSLGRQHCGRKGDYLVESSEGVLTITPRKIFEDIYVAMTEAHLPENNVAASIEAPVEALQIHEVRINHSPFGGTAASGQPRNAVRKTMRTDASARARRNLPAEICDRSVAPRLGLA